MFCKSCGTKLEDGAKFCPYCGTPVKQAADVEENVAATNENFEATKPSASTVIIRPAKLEIPIRGTKSAGTDSYYAFTYFVPLGILFLGCYLCGVESEGLSNFGLFLVFVGIVFAAIARQVIFKRSVLYNENEKKFVFNEHAHLDFSKKSINLNEIKSIRFRCVKISLFKTKFSLNDYGKYDVISFDSNDKEKSLSVWFGKKGNAEEFLPVIDYALKSNGLQIGIDRKEDLINFEGWEAESNRSNVKF